MWNKFIKIEEKDVTVGQTASGIWICKEAKAENPKDAGKLMSAMNIELNKANGERKVSPATPSYKNTKTNVKGLK